MERVQDLTKGRIFGPLIRFALWRGGSAGGGTVRGKRRCFGCCHRFHDHACGHGGDDGSGHGTDGPGGAKDRRGEKGRSG